MADKKFKPHMMYSKDGEEEMANTLADHKRLSKTKTKLHSPAPFKMAGYPLHYGTSPAKFKGADSSNSSCWKGCKKVGTKKGKYGRTVNDCDCG
tara:strand:+ start:314 stop:595 length:282 start_codon:yes stop_codon:yes gene_type:complete